AAPPQQTGDGGGTETLGNNPSSSPSSSSSSLNPIAQLAGANGSDASAGAMLHVRWSATAKTALAGAYDHAQTVVGQLTAPSGAPIGGALVQVLSTPGYEGARTTALAALHTATDGSLRLRLPAGLPSSRLTFAYSSRAGLAVPDVTAALTLTVPASVRLDVTPRTSHAGGTIVFSGTLHGSPLPPGGKTLVLEARAEGAGAHSPWRQFQVLATRAHGRYRATYRFRLPGPITYAFRAVSPAEADFPYGAGVSNLVRVYER
ncbi:MAG: carboxypeptidase-like regulatory domain-containing protein, partial [Solirubrobacteraceae bacterium]